MNAGFIPGCSNGEFENETTRQNRNIQLQVKMTSNNLLNYHVVAYEIQALSKTTAKKTVDRTTKKGSKNNSLKFVVHRNNVILVLNYSIEVKLNVLKDSIQ